MRRSFVGRGMLLGFLVSALACGDGGSARGSAAGASDGTTDADAPAHTVRDSAGVRIVENLRPTRPGSWTIQRSPLVTIGGPDAAPDYQLWMVNEAMRLADGRIVVANSGSKEVRWYSASGTYLGSAGGAGDGPGEFQAVLLNLVELGGDSVGVYDLTARRLSIFGSDMNLVRTVRMDRLEESQGTSFTPLVGLADGGLLLRSATPASLRTAGSFEVERPAHEIYRYVEGNAPKLLVELPGPEHVVGPTDRSSPSTLRSTMPVRREFGRTSTIGAHVARWVTGDTGSPELRFRDPRDGKTTTVTRWRAEPVPVTAADLEAEREWREQMGRGSLRPSEGVDPHETRPYFTSIGVGHSGNVWVREYRPRGQTGPSRYLVFDSTGVWLDTVEVPSGLVMASVGEDWVLAWSSTELGIVTVSLHRLVER